MLILRNPSQTPRNGFTIVELLIVIVVIGILASLTAVAFNGVQNNARDSQRKNDVRTIATALELYYLDNGRFPPASGSTSINGSWSTTVDPSSWQNLANYLVPEYISELPIDPSNTPGLNPHLYNNVFGYSYFTNQGSGATYCGSTGGQMYILTYRLEGAPQTNTFKGNCTTTPLSYGSMSNYRVAR